MKRIVAIMLILAMTFMLCACGEGKAFDKSGEAYKNINSAYELIENFGSDLYEAWRLGIYEGKSINSASALASEISLTEEELEMGAAYIMNGGEVDPDGGNGKNFSTVCYLYDNKFSAFVSIVSAAYDATGKSAEIQQYLDNAKSLMKELSEKYSDYEHYPNLKGFYTTACAFFDFCQNPTGSFEQVKTTLNDYKNEAREYRNDLAYVFGDDEFEDVAEEIE